MQRNGTPRIRHDGVGRLLEGAHVFVTGATGFLGKAIVEKLLRDVAGVARVTMLVRTRRGSSAQERMQREIVASPIFDRLRDELGDAAFAERAAVLHAVEGDIVREHCGMTQTARDTLPPVHVVLHCAASINFDDRIDRAVTLNVDGALHMLHLAMQWPTLVSYVHISTAYVNCQLPSGTRVQEKIYPLPFDVHEMLARIKGMDAQQLNDFVASGTMGRWPNTYTFTKNMAEHMVYDAWSKNVSTKAKLAIVRPAVIGGAYRDPIPGWIDDIAAAAAIYAGIMTGVIKMIPGSRLRVLDVVPVDYTVNTVLLAAAAVQAMPDNFLVVHSGSSHLNPLRFKHVLDSSFEHLNSDNLPARCQESRVRVEFYSESAYKWLFALRYKLPVQVLSMLSTFGTSKQRQQAHKSQRLIDRLDSVVGLFHFFLCEEYEFLTMNTFAQWDGNRNPDERHMFRSDVWTINWEQWSLQFFAGIAKFCFGDDYVILPAPEHDDPKLYINSATISKLNTCSVDTLLNDDRALTFQESPQESTRWFPRLFSTLNLALDHMASHPRPATLPPLEMKNMVLGSHRVQEAIARVAHRDSTGIRHTELEAELMLRRIVGDTDYTTLIGTGMLVRTLFRILFDTVTVNEMGVRALLEAAKRGPLVYLPTHRSYIDFLIISFVCFLYGLPMPFIAAGEDFLSISFISTLLRYSGAFFMRRSFLHDELYSSIFQEYMTTLLRRGHSIEFFIEGTRSRSGKTLHPKTGLLSFVTEALDNGDIEAATLCPITVTYERILERELYRNELHGERKPRESLWNLIRGLPSLLTKLGQVSIHIDTNPILLEKKAAAAPALGYVVAQRLERNAQCTPTHIVATLLLLYRQGITRQELGSKCHMLAHEVHRRGGSVAFYDFHHHDNILRRALGHLGAVVTETRRDVFEPAVQLHERHNLLLLAHYRNALLHWFFDEAIIACAFHAFDAESVPRNDLLREAVFLYTLLYREIIVSSPDGACDRIYESMARMEQRGTLQTDPSGFTSVLRDGEFFFSFLCSLCWPLVDSYYIAALILFNLQPDHALPHDELVQRAQWLGTTLFNESMICCYESCSADPIRNAMAMFKQRGILCVQKRTIVTLRRKRTMNVDTLVFSLSPAFQDEHVLQELISHVMWFKKPSKVTPTHRKEMIARIPMLAKL